MFIILYLHRNKFTLTMVCQIILGSPIPKSHFSKLSFPGAQCYKKTPKGLTLNNIFKACPVKQCLFSFCKAKIEEKHKTYLFCTFNKNVFANFGLGPQICFKNLNPNFFLAIFL